MQKIWVKVTLFWYGCWLLPKTHPLTKLHPFMSYRGRDMDLNKKALRTDELTDGQTDE